jgi:hypothetical protein
LDPRTTLTDDARGAKAAAEAGNSWGGMEMDVAESEHTKRENRVQGNKTVVDCLLVEGQQ